MQNPSYRNRETLVMGCCMQGILFLRVQYQKIMTHLPQSIVCMAYRTGQTAVASIPWRAALSGLLGPLMPYSLKVLQMYLYPACEMASDRTLSFYKRRGFASQPHRFVERVYYKAEGMSRGEIG